MIPPIRLLLVATLAASLALATGCERSRAAAPADVTPPPEIPVVRATAQTAPDALAFTGRLDAVHRIELRPRVTGSVSALRFREGDLVRAGDVLFEVDPRPYRARRDQAAAEVARANAALALAQQENARARTLRATEAISAEDAERRAAEAAAAEATRRAAQAALAAAELDLEFTTVRAPVDGRVGRALLTIGNLARADQSVLATIVSIDPMRVRFAIDEPTFHRLLIVPPRHTLAARVSIQGIDRSFAAEVDYLGNAVDTATGTVEIRATLADRNPLLVDGMFARVELLLPANTSRVIVPETALGAEQGSRYVLVVGADNKLAQRRVVLGPRLAEQRTIASGIDAGEYIVTGGLQFLRPGMTIRPVKPAGDTLAQHSRQ